MTRTVSYAQNLEDVVLARALRDVENGTYLDVGANDPDVWSVTRSFYDRGWSGICVEPVPSLAAKFRAARPRDAVVEAVISDSEQSLVRFHLIPDSGLSTLRDDVAAEHAQNGWPVEDVTVRSMTLTEVVERSGLSGHDRHFAVIDTEGAEIRVLRSADFDLVRPWILVVEATAPMSTRQVYAEWEQLVMDAGYRFGLFDGLSRFYYDGRDHPELGASLTYPAGVFDDFITIDQIRLTERVEAAERESARAQTEIDELHLSTSWRITAPLRALRGRVR